MVWKGELTNVIKSLPGFGLVLWHINLCRLFKAKSSLYIILNA